MSNYKPPYTITSNILKSVSEISELLSDIKHIDKNYSTLTLRKKNRIKSITGTLQIEGNTFDEAKVTNVINGKTVLGTVREIEEVKGAVKAYDKLDTFSYKKEKDLLLAHKLLMQNILENAGTYRSSNVGVGGKDGVTHVAPPPNMVPQLMGDIFNWLQSSDEHLLITSCVFHYEFEFIHPFSDGNGRIGRLWQTVILASFKDLFAYIPIESMVRNYQEKYYQALEDAGSVGESTPFIEFMLEIILDTIKNSLDNDQASDYVSDQVEKLLNVMNDKWLSSSEIMEKLELSHKPTFRKNYLNPALENGLIEMHNPDSPRSPKQKYRKK